MKYLLGILGLYLALLAAGCATTENREESDLPWNTPQPWETAPTIPGLNDR
ncbi:MAG TPA: hypothetical protein P5567_00310 [Kiritimatiellia bacterium]|nr:hypothetical protein [Kiritimatiellia bacterium]HSA18850.1 hypothetical protein [Kiritimatiellia bacterium]